MASPESFAAATENAMLVAFKNPEIRLQYCVAEDGLSRLAVMRGYFPGSMAAGYLILRASMRPDDPMVYVDSCPSQKTKQYNSVEDWGYTMDVAEHSEEVRAGILRVSNSRKNPPKTPVLDGMGYIAVEYPGRMPGTIFDAVKLDVLDPYTPPPR